MKKFLTVSLLFVMLVMAFATVVNAATSATLADELYAKGSKYGMTASDKVKIERYLSENPVTDEQANAIVAKADEAVTLMESVGATNYDDLTTEQKTQLKTIATSAADLINVKLVLDDRNVKITVKDDWKKKMNKEDKNINTSQSIIKHRKDKSVYK